ncbi:T-Complex Protein 11 [Manis pentadactyla]|nr:T-Complex Protein 11 [Manis pentadactyla]
MGKPVLAFIVEELVEMCSADKANTPRWVVGEETLELPTCLSCPGRARRADFPDANSAPFLPNPDSINKITDVEDSVLLKDAESGSCLKDRVNDVSKLSNKTGKNHDFHVEDQVLPTSSLEDKVKETIHNAFWDHLKEQLSATLLDFSCALELLKEIKEILLSLLLLRQNCLRNEIEEALDMDLLKQKAEQRTLNVLQLSQYILSMMTLLCAPVRDEAVQKLENVTVPVQLLSGIFQVLGLMKMDMVNYTIQSLQPHLQEHSIQHERAKFQEPLNKQPSLLDHTTKWLTQTASSPEPLSPTAVLSQGYLNLILWDPENEEFPETLLTDRTRLQELQSQLHQLTILASILLVGSSFSGSVLFGLPQFVDKLKRITKALMEEFNSRPEEAVLPVSKQVNQEIHRSLKNNGLTALSSDNTASLMGQLQNIAKKEDCVCSVIDQRIHLFLKCCLVLGVQWSLLDLPGGLCLSEAELAKLGQKSVNLTHHNWQVFGPYYVEILKPSSPQPRH